MPEQTLMLNLFALQELQNCPAAYDIVSVLTGEHASHLGKQAAALAADFRCDPLTVVCHLPASQRAYLSERLRAWWHKQHPPGETDVMT